MSMKTRTGILLIVILLHGLSSAYGSSPCSEFSNEWIKCEADSDCVLDETECYSIAAYHKQHLESVREHNHCMRPMIKCATRETAKFGMTTSICRKLSHSHSCAIMEKYNRWSDLTTGINPFVPPPHKLPSNVVLRWGQILVGGVVALARWVLLLPLLVLWSLLELIALLLVRRPAVWPR